VESDFHQRQAESFLHSFADVLGQRVQEGQIHSLVLVAPARALGVLRSHLSDVVRRTVMAEIDHDYVKMPLYEIERRLAALQR
jgi:protein required for attachment to host cells